MRIWWFNQRLKEGEANEETKMFFSRGEYSEEAVDVVVTPMCSEDEKRWTKCQVSRDECKYPYRVEKAVLIL